MRKKRRPVKRAHPKIKGPGYKKTCPCGELFLSSWPNGVYCSKDCRVEGVRLNARKRYAQDPETALESLKKKQSKRKADRWGRILDALGDFCSKCGVTYPTVVYDLHHPKGKKSRADTPSRVILNGSNKAFEEMLSQVVILCANCHRLHHHEEGDWAPAGTKKRTCEICHEVFTSKAPRKATCDSPECIAVKRAFSGNGSKIRTGQ